MLHPIRPPYAAFLGIAAFLAPLTASAVSYFESSDAGETLVTAQSVPGGTSSIVGSLNSDADLFSFQWGGGGFYANSVGSSFDSQLFLFNSSGGGVLGNDDGISFAGPAYLQLADLAPGSYYIGISGFDYDPYSNGGMIFNSAPWSELHGPNNSQALTHWNGDYSYSGNYSINFQEITANGNPVGNPNPTGTVPDTGGTLAIFSLSLLGLGAAQRKFRK